MTAIYRFLVVVDANGKGAAERLLRDSLKDTDGAHVIDIEDWPEPVLSPDDTVAEVESMIGKKKP